MQPQDTPRKGKTLVDLVCQQCGQPFRRALGAVNNGQTKYCGRACYHASRIGMERPNLPRKPIADRLWAKVDTSSECWHWMGSKLPKGYGYMSRGRAIEGRDYVHRIAWELATGEILANEDVIGHTCDTPDCVRNDDVGTYVVNGVELPRVGHLFKGTTQNNHDDMRAKGRGPVTKGLCAGERHGQAKLTEGDVRTIRQRAANGEPNAALAREFGVSAVLVGLIVRRRLWQHVE